MNRIRGRRLQRIRAEHFRRNPLCMLCLQADPPRYTLATQLDHIIALINKGQDIASNRQGLCTSCHKAKTAKDLGISLNPKRTIGSDGWPV